MTGSTFDVVVASAVTVVSPAASTLSDTLMSLLGLVWTIAEMTEI